MDAGQVYSDLLDGLGIAAAEYSADLRAVRWNATFLRFFPEHTGHIAAGEPYADNLRRFYRARLDGEDLAEIERVVAEGVQRHLSQSAPFEFEHHGRRLRVNSALLPSGGRVRVWTQVDARPAAPASVTPAFDSLDKIAEGACILDAHNRIMVANARFRELYDIEESDVIVGLHLDEVIARVWRTVDAFAAMRAAIRNGLRYDSAPFEIELPRDRWRRVITRHADSEHAYLVHSDITAGRRKERELNRLVTLDPLTGLLNRRGLAEYLERLTGPVTFIAIDADHFKKLNDDWGHAAGDRCLQRIADELRDIAGSALGVAARLGGEEFAVVLGTRTASEIAALAERIRSRVADSGEPAVTVSIGIASGPHGAAREEADRALYRAKRGGRNRIEIEKPWHAA